MTDSSWTAPSHAQVEAGAEMTDVIVGLLRSDRGVHAETAISAGARMAGTFLFRSFNLATADVAPGTPVLSQAANDEGPKLIATLGSTLDALQVGFDPEKMGQEPGPGHESHLSLADTRQRLELTLRQVAARHGLTDHEAAHACAIAVARLMQMTARVLEPHIGFSIAAFGFVEGSKTMPPPLEQAHAAARPKKSWWRW